MENVSNEKLLAELKNRFDQKDEMMREQRKLMRQLEKINERLMESEKIQSRFLSNIRNEINNPLTAILGMSREMMHGTFEKNQSQKNASLIFAESFQLSFQLQNIFLAAELEAGQAQPYIMNVQINPLVENTLSNFTHLIAKKKLKVKFNSDFFEDFTFRTDPEKLKVILSNLIMNSVEYTLPGGEITIATFHQRDGKLSISVQDNGEGIAEDKINAVFDRFVQLNNGSTKIHPGHGLGLSVVNSMVELLSGKVDVVSKTGKGSVFLITLPEPEEANDLNGDSQDGNEFMFDSDDVISV
jgi:signal transduction histidine kinase